ncbi:hypothetical protein KGF54_003109 [Candida jiufengensis]|uniref:uncharacterized protein n=1 Tax=Candida jiufengensis TaxID=497108 RepID=UPI002224EB93|nr:uncharacterized protein KGF54_003109 [Candida jiufengensis]KAI5952243.1 hypothetical protein KGF54_003109 [Candida jiufengensis]
MMNKNTRESKKRDKEELLGISTSKNRPKNITNLHELLPGLNDISDAFEALPLDIIKYFTLLKEIDAKCINTIPQINVRIKNYIENLHIKYNETKLNKTNQEKLKDNQQLNIIKNKINEIIPCLEEKMHVTSVATDLLNKHMYRINQDYKLIIQNNEIPENIRIGPLVHPAMILDSNTGSSKDSATTNNGNNNGNGNSNNNNNSLNSQRSESRREALAAKKVNKDDDKDSGSGGQPSTSNAGRKKKNKEQTPLEGSSNTKNSTNDPSVKKRRYNTSDDKSTKKKKKNENGNNNNDEDDIRDYDNQINNNNNNSTSTNNNNNSSGGRSRNLSINSDNKSIRNEPTYCYCNQVSFGEMVGCDGDDCKREWFHLPCIGFKNPPKGKWYCDDCVIKMKKTKKY